MGTWPTSRGQLRGNRPVGLNVRDRMPRLVPKKPGREHRVGALEQPRRGQRTTRGERHDDRLAKVKYGFGERALASRQAQIGSARRFPAHPRALAKAEPDNPGARAKIDCGRYPAYLLSIDVDAGGVIDLALRQRRLEALENGHDILRLTRRSPGSEHLARRCSQRTDNCEAFDLRG